MALEVGIVGLPSSGKTTLFTALTKAGCSSLSEHTVPGALEMPFAVYHLVRKVDARTGKISTVAGTGQKGFSGDGSPYNAGNSNSQNLFVLGGVWLF